MKNKTRVFIRTTVIGTVISMSIIFGSMAVCSAYESIRQLGFGEYKNAVELTESSIRILDFTIHFKGR